MATKFTETTQYDGFDDVPLFYAPWQMVPLGGTKIVALIDAQGMDVLCDNPYVAMVTDVKGHRGKHRRILITGLVKGTARIYVMKGSETMALLDVSVKEKKTVKVSFNFVTDETGKTTGRTHREVDRMLRIVNAIFTPQTNIVMEKHKVRDVTIKKNLGPIVRHIPSNVREHDWDDVVASGDSTADLNVFFVWEFEMGTLAPEKDIDAGASASQKSCIFEDNIGSRRQHEMATLAHEIGHCLGVSEHSLLPHDLMYGDSTSSGAKIPKGHANTMNPDPF